jgi:hypothetical protein
MRYALCVNNEAGSDTNRIPGWPVLHRVDGGSGARKAPLQESMLG